MPSVSSLYYLEVEVIVPVFSAECVNWKYIVQPVTVGSPRLNSQGLY